MLLSIIIPVYNVESYLNRCVDSVLNQQNTNTEIILVDDGSPDNSGMICDYYYDHFKNIKVVHKENGGLSSARNKGIELSEGKYVMFLDSDDWLDDGCIEKFIEIIEKKDTDLIIGKAKIIDERENVSDKVTYYIKEGEYSSEEYLRLLNRPGSYSACAPFTICKRSFLNKHGIRFLEGVVQEDELWTPTILLKAETIYYSDVYFYNNYMRSDSITHSTNKKIEGDNLLKVAIRVLKLFEENDVSSAQVLTDKLVFNYLRAICLVDNFDKERELFTARKLWKYALFRNTKCKVALYSISPRLYILVHNIVKG